MNILFHREVLKQLRDVIEQAWNEETAHPGKGGDKGRPEGQCYVTSRLLADVYKIGRVVIGSVGKFKNHCWLEMEIDDIKFFLDMTADQAGIGKEPIVWGMYEPHPKYIDNPKYRVYPDYKPKREVEDEDAKRFFAAFDRYLLLKKRVAAIVAQSGAI